MEDVDMVLRLHRAAGPPVVLPGPLQTSGEARVCSSLSAAGQQRVARPSGLVTAAASAVGTAGSMPSAMLCLYCRQAVAAARPDKGQCAESYHARAVPVRRAS